MKKTLYPINDYTFFQTLYKSLKKRVKNPCTNCMFPGKTVRESILKGTLFYREFPEGLILYSADEKYYCVYYFLDNSKPLPDISSNKMLLLEELDSHNKRKVYLENFSKKLYEAGFYLEAENYQFEINLNDHCDWIFEEYKRAEDRINQNGLFSTCDLTTNQVCQVLDLWNLSLKPADVPSEHKRFIRDKNQYIICVLNKSGNVCGTLWWTYHGNICEIRHIVTHPDYYRMGISSYTMLYSFVKSIEANVVSSISFVDIHNEKSIHMHRRVGMKENGKVSLQFLLEAEQ